MPLIERPMGSWSLDERSGTVLCSPGVEVVMRLREPGAASRLIARAVEHPDRLRTAAAEPASSVIRIDEMVGDVGEVEVVSWAEDGDTGRRWVGSVSRLYDGTAIDRLLAELSALQTERAELIADAAAAEARERQRINDELHDTILGSLSAVVMQLQRISESIEDTSAAGVIAEASRAVAGLRGEFSGLFVKRPVRPPSQDLMTRVSEFCAGIFERTGTSVEVSGDASGVDAQSAQVAFRIIQELARNALRHADATCFSVTVAVVEDKLRVRVRDDGAGLLSAPQRTGSRGLSIAHRRAREAGGSLRIKAGSVDGGTQVDLILPDIRSRRWTAD